MSEDEGAAPVAAKKKPRSPRPRVGNAVADFDCLSGKCDKKGMIVSYELPIGATRCPVCGSKKIKRRYDTQRVAIKTRVLTPDFTDMRHTSSSKAARIDQLAEPAMLQADASAARMREASSKYPNARMVPTGKIGHALGEVYQGMTRGVPAVSVDPPSRKAERGGDLGVVQEMAEARQGQVPTVIRGRDPEFKVVRKADGSVGMEKA